MATSNDRSDHYRPVNAMLGAQPRVGPLPANQLFPWAIISLSIWFVCQFLSVPMIWTALLVFWGDVTWWLLTGKTPWKFLSKFIRVPHLTRGQVKYRSIYAYMADQQTEARTVQTKAKRKKQTTQRRPKR